jgi:hypothetical protein
MCPFWINNQNQEQTHQPVKMAKGVVVMSLPSLVPARQRMVDPELLVVLALPLT